MKINERNFICEKGLAADNTKSKLRVVLNYNSLESSTNHQPLIHLAEPSLRNTGIFTINRQTPN